MIHSVKIIILALIIMLFGYESSAHEDSAGARKALSLNSKGYTANNAVFPITVWLQDPRLAAKYKAAGINGYIGLWKGPTEAQLAALKKANMPVICDQNKVGLSSPNNDIIIAWMHGDEPDNAQKFSTHWKSDFAKVKAAWPEITKFKTMKQYRGYGPPIPPKTIIADYKKIKQTDPNRPVILNLGQGVAWKGWGGRGERTGRLDDYPKYIKGCDFVSFDIYPGCHSHPDVAGKLWYVAKGVERLKKWSNAKKPLWCCIETTRIANKQGKMATPSQVKAEVWMAITRGATGLIYFVHEFKPKFNASALLDNPEMLKAVTAVNKQIQQLAPVLNSPTQTDLVTLKISNAAAPISVMVKKYDGAVYILTVALRPSNNRATFTIKGIANGKVEVLGENRQLKLKNGTFSDKFSAYQVHLYKIITK